MSQRTLTSREIQFLQESLSTDYKNGTIRLREGEYQYELAKTIASFQLKLYFPDVKDIIKRLYGEEKTRDIQFIRKIQTILKKMEKSNVVRILPKKKPWELQRYSLLSFKFLDNDKNFVIFATDEQTTQMQNILHLAISQVGTPKAKLGNAKTRAFILVFIIVASYVTIVWDLMQYIISPIIFISVFSIAVVCSIMLGKILSQQ